MTEGREENSPEEPASHVTGAEGCCDRLAAAAESGLPLLVHPELNALPPPGKRQRLGKTDEKLVRILQHSIKVKIG